jgi:hypothetical protein
MVQTDPIHAIERSLADNLAAALGHALGLAEPRVEAHFREGTVVCLIEAADLPDDAPDTRERAETAIDAVVCDVLGRHIARPMAVTRPSPTEALVMLRLI